jgi:hypothetical protein
MIYQNLSQKLSKNEVSGVDCKAGPIYADSTIPRTVEDAGDLDEPLFKYMLGPSRSPGPA